MREKTLVINTPWATETFEGRAVPSFRHTPAEEINEYLSACSQLIRSFGYSVADMPSPLAVSSETHRWGMAPYHYGAPAYEWIRDQMIQRLKP